MTASSSMYLDSNLRIEILSSLLGQTIKPYDKKSRGTSEDILSVDEFHLHNLTGKCQAYVKQPIIKEEDFFDPDYDCDFTNLSNTSADCKRGDELYERPKGWYRMALKVKDKYLDGDTWLGTKGWRNHSVPGEWPVSYHGTSIKGAKGIIKSHYSAGNGDLYGRGIYSTPDIHVAEREEYAKTFTSKTTGKSYKIILQNRINPQMREICQRFDYWLVPVRKGASAEEERKIVDSSIRPYGILIKELNDGDDSDEVYGDGYEVSDDYDSDSYDRHDDGSWSDSGDEDDDIGDGDDDGDEDDDIGDGDDGDEDDDIGDGDDDGDEDDDIGDGDDDGDEDDDIGDGDEDASEDEDGDDGDGKHDDGSVSGNGDEDGDIGDDDGDEDASEDKDGDDGDEDGEGNESEDDGTVQDHSDDSDGGDDDGDGDEDFDEDGSYNDGKHDADYSEDTCNDDGDDDDYHDDFDDVSGSYDDDDDWS